MAFFINTNAAQTLSGSNGNDQFVILFSTAGAGVDIFDGLGGNDTISGGTDNDTLTGGTGDDLLFGGDGNDVLNGGEDNDILDGGLGNDELRGGSGFNTADYSNAPAAVTVDLNVNPGVAQNTGGGGIDTLLGIAGLVGSAFNDTLTGNSSDNTFAGGLGDDSINGSVGVDTLDYSSAANGIFMANAGIVTGEGTDAISGIDRIIGTDFDDTIRSGSANGLEGNDMIVLAASTGISFGNGGGGNDIIVALSQIATTVSGGTGIDMLDLGSHDAVSGILDSSLTVIDGNSSSTYALQSADVENFVFTFGDDSVSAALNIDQDNILDMGGGDDEVHGGLGEDILLGGAGDDLLDGEGDDDTADYSYIASGNVSVDLANAGAQLVKAGDTDTLISIENLAGGLANDTFKGNGGNNRLAGNGGDDTLEGGVGDDFLDGGEGSDTAVYSASAGAVALDLALAGQQTGGQSGADNFASIENLVGSSFGDVLGGDGAANILSGRGGGDEMSGGGGDDTLDGGEDGDTLDGGDGDDHIAGGNGDDTLSGGNDDDTLAGGAGADAMSGGTGNDIYEKDVAGDIVTEAANGGIDLVRTSVNSLTLGANVEKLTFTGTGNFTGRGNALNNTINGNAGDDRFLVDAGGNDVFSGGQGTDAMDYQTSAAGIAIDLAAGVHGGAAAGEIFASIEKFFGSNAASDTMTGGASRDKFSGFGGNDTLSGGANIDTLQGGAGNDTLDGGAARDTLQGGLGDDTMAGGADIDFFLFVEADFGQDVVTDFQDGLDKLKFGSAAADAFGDFTVSGNATNAVILSLAADPAQTITLQSAAPINIQASDFIFF